MITRRPARLHARLRIVAGCLALMVALAACESPEERAERHFQSALALIEEGDTARAIVELRTVFSLQELHVGAREALAQIYLDEGDLTRAMAEYTRLVEQDPDNLDAVLVLAENYALVGDIETASVHARTALELAPDNLRAQAVEVAVAYGTAVTDGDAEARQDSVARAQAMIVELPESTLLRAVVVDATLLAEEYESVLEQLGPLQGLAPDDRRFWQMRLIANGRLGDMDAVERTLIEMTERFPDDATLPASLIRFYANRQDPEGAEAFLRGRIVEGEQNDEARVTLVGFLAEIEGSDAALAQVEAFIEEGTNTPLFRSIRASLNYDMGNREAALAEFEDILDVEESTVQLDDIGIAFAQLLLRDGNEVGARSRIERVLESDPGHVMALIMQARWLVEADRADEAISALRRAQDQEPENPEIYTAMAAAHLRNGERELAGEMLSIAVENANNAPEQTLDYARFLRGEGRYLPAETLVIDALRIAPRNLDLMAELANVYLAMEDWARAEDVEQALRNFDDPRGLRMADQVRLGMLQGSGRIEEALALIEERADAAGEGTVEGRAGRLALVVARLRAGETESASEQLDALLAETPDDPTLLFLSAQVSSAMGDPDRAAEIYQALLDQGIRGERVYQELIRAQMGLGQSEAARRTLETALAELPEAPNLMWMQASLLEQEGDLEGAISVYETMYERDTSSPIIANNLASLLSTARTDQDSLDRAERIARRLAGTDFAPFRDTYGWIAYRQGDYETALDYLTPAAEALPDQPLVQYHLGMTLAALDRTAEAIAQLQRALDLAADDPHPAFDMARSRLEQLQNGDTPAVESE